jgi:hypothetical protein
LWRHIFATEDTDFVVESKRVLDGGMPPWEISLLEEETYRNGSKP